MKKIIIILIILILLIGGGWYFYSQEEETEDLDTTTEDQEIATEEEEEIVTEEEQDQDNIYDQTETVEPIGERNIVMDEDFREILNEVFEKDPKLTKAGEILILSYTVNRPITSDDVIQVRDLLEEKEYEIEGVESREDEYEINVSAEILEQEYQGNIYVRLFTAQEGENAQKIEVRIL